MQNSPIESKDYFSLEILSPKAKRISNSYVTLPYKSRYSLMLRNQGPLFADVILYLNHQRLDVYRVYAHSSLIIHTPPLSKTKFTFNTKSIMYIGASFLPAKEGLRFEIDRSKIHITSGQQFFKMARLCEEDVEWSRVQDVTLRLIAG